LLGLAGEDMLVVAITAVPHESPASLGLAAIPANARLAAFVPYHAIMALASVVVTNGGYGGVQMALRHGVPLVVAAGSEEKPEIAARVAWCGAGLNLKTGRPSPKAVCAAVGRALAEPAFRAHAQLLAREMARYDAPGRAADLIEQLATTRAPVLRRDAAARLLPKPDAAAEVA
jgi:UDP:flavonoid glycosyltransferase YjiC (YdhE family)